MKNSVNVKEEEKSESVKEDIRFKPGDSEGNPIVIENDEE